MSLAPVVSPYQPINGLTGLGLNNGYLYIGLDGQDPETDPQNCFWDAAGVVPAMQPIPILGGYPMRLGTPARLYTAATYSIRVRDATGSQVFYEAHAVPGANVADGAFATFADAAGASIPPAVHANGVTLLGYYAPGDGGGGFYRYSALQPTHPGKFQSVDGAWWELIEYRPNPKQFGAHADGVMDDATGIEKAFAYANYFLAASASSAMAWAQDQRSVTFLPGQYVYGGVGITQATGNIQILAEPRSVTITLTAAVYLLTFTGYVDNIFVRGLHVVGGLGAIKLTRGGSNVGGMMIVEDCYFDNYTQCAFGNMATDAPYLKVSRCMFMGAAAGGTIGIAWGGYADLMDVSDCAFQRNKYHVKIGDRLSGNICLRNCDFISFTAGVRTADIWIVPNITPGTFGTNSGTPIAIDDCKFGNENQQAADVRVLVALEDAGSGANRLTRSHSTTWTTADAWVGSIVFARNRIVGVDPGTAPFLRSYISQLRRLVWTRDNRTDGGNYTYLAQFMGTDINEEAFTTRSWDVELGSPIAGSQAFSGGVSNRVIGIVQDLFAVAGLSEGVIIPSTLGDDTTYVEHVVSNDPTALNLNSATRTAITDARGQAAMANQVEATAPAGGFFRDFQSSRVGGVADPLPNRLNWLELELKRATVNPVNQVQVTVQNFVTNAKAFSMPVTLLDHWKRLRVPFILPDTTDPAWWIVVVNVIGYSAGVAENFDLGRYYVYQGDQPMNSSALQTIGSGAWDGAHIVMQQWHLWIDATGTLRIKNAPPTFDTDGTVVGTQV